MQQKVVGSVAASMVQEKFCCSHVMGAKMLQCSPMPISRVFCTHIAVYLILVLNLINSILTLIQAPVHSSMCAATCPLMSTSRRSCPTTGAPACPLPIQPSNWPYSGQPHKGCLCLPHPAVCRWRLIDCVIDCVFVRTS